MEGLHSAAYVLAAASFASSLLALVRDHVFAHMFGAGATLDIYYAAFQVPDILFVGTSAIVSVYILIPELAKRDDAAKSNYLDSVLVGFFAMMILKGLLYLQ